MRLLFFVCLAVVLSGCSRLTEFDIDYTSSTTVPSSAGINLPFDVMTPDVTTNSETEFENNNTNKNLVDKIVLKKMTLTVHTPNNGNFGFLKSIEIFINADGLSEKKIAWNNNVDSSAGATIELTSSGDELKEYVKSDKFKLRVNTVTDQLIAQDYTIDIYTLFTVNAKLL
ncbi:MAG: hypothetical protein ACKOXB_06505 [Flavobacteriales bacterium]